MSSVLEVWYQHNYHAVDKLATSATMGSFAVVISLGFGLVVLGFLLLKARILTKRSETTLVIAVRFCILLVSKKNWVQ